MTYSQDKKEIDYSLFSILFFVPSNNTCGTCFNALAGHSELRVYDPSLPQRRPVLDCRWGEDPLTCLTLREGRDELVYVGNSKGQVAALDLRRRGTVCGHFKKISGSVRALACAGPGDPALFSCSSDRFLRIHHLETRELLKEVRARWVGKTFRVITKSTVHERKRIDGL